ncbi:MAG: YdcF family protein [Dysgonomonas sp.]|nr:YdcF family protein [Dysgonomonas sp.]
MKKIVLILGAPNDDQGVLSNIALDRLNCAYEFYKCNDNVKLLCTGGFGKHFNTTDKPHVSYAMSFLINKGIPEDSLLEPVLSSNTVDDFRLAKERILSYYPSILIIITSDFHIERVRILQKVIINFPDVIFISAKSTLPEEELYFLIKHEEKAIRELKANNYRIY